MPGSPINVFVRLGGKQALAGLLLAAAFACPVSADAGTQEVQAVVGLVDAGSFAEAESSLAKSLESADVSADEKSALLFQRERMRRILLDFTLGEDQAKAQIRKQIPDLGDEEFARWDGAGLLEYQLIDGRKLYFNRAPSNLFRLSAEARARRRDQTPLVDGPMEAANAHHREVIDAAPSDRAKGAGSRHVRVDQSLTVDANAVPAGETVRAWIPYPRAIAGQQEDIRFIESTPAAHQIAPESTLQRTVYLEKPAIAGQATKFSISYELTVHGQYHAIDADKVLAAPLTAELAPFVAERPPHVVFTPAIREFSRKVVGDEKNPYRIAQKLFAAVDKIPWAGAREYSTITNISDYALHAGHADCGQQTLLLITLLRLNGIPARWQSGMVYSDGDYDNLHDWGGLYLQPYGWVPMDVTTGRLDDPDPQVAGFYLGGLDAYRIAFNDDFSQDLVPAKRHFRSETVDLQRGEAEWSGGNLYFDQWDYQFEGKVLPPKSSAE
ncbi:MAG: transglutaminase-like domain-containing protein [Pseudoxanthomonas sp.]